LPNLPLFLGQTTLPHSQKITPLVFDDSLSYLQQIARLLSFIEQIRAQIADFAAKEDVKAVYDHFTADQIRQTRELIDYADDIARALKIYVDKSISDLIAGDITVQDPTFGLAPRTIQTVIWSMYDFVRYYADDAQTLDGLELTATQFDSKVASMDVQNTSGARAFDVYNATVFSESMVIG